MKQAMISKTLGLPSSAVSNLYTGKRVLQYDEAQKLHDAWPSGAKPVRSIPVIGMAGAGNWLEAIESADESIEAPADAGGAFAVRVVGDSMDLMLPEGSRAIVDPEKTDLFVGKLYLIKNAEEEVTIKRYRSDPARFEPVSSNEAHKAFSLGSGRFTVIGQVTGGFQNFA